MRNYPLQLFYWYWGKIFQAYMHDEGAAFDLEFAYLHFQKRKLPRPSFDPLSAEGFLITPDGFFPYRKENLTLEDFLKYDRSRCKTPPELVAQFRSGIGVKLRHLTGESTKSG